VIKGDVLEWITWGGGGLGDPLTRPPHIVAKEVHRRLVTFEGAQRNYGVVVTPDFSVDEPATTSLRAEMSRQRRPEGNAGDSKLMNGDAGEQAQGGNHVGYDRGGTMSELIGKCKEETGLEPPRPQWERDPYGPHTGLPYVKEWYRRMREEGMGDWDRI
jgi:5-oxoprolinase (ATP-hydrolysing)